MDREAEQEMVRRLAGGDSSAFDSIYDLYRGRLYGFLTRLTRRRDLAEDLLEETWLRLIRHAGRMKPEAPLGPWLFAVARNLFFSYCRSRGLEDERLGELMGPWPKPGAPASPFEEVAADELQRRVEIALAAMPVHYREVLLLSAVEEMSPAEIAEICGVTAEALRQRLLRARAMLAHSLKAGAARRRNRNLGEVPA